MPMLIFRYKDSSVENRVVFDFSKATKSILKVHSLALSDFLNDYTSVSFYSQYSVSSHSVCVAQKTMLCQQKKYFI